MALNVGVLVIGSLIWDRKTHREGWRRERLVTDRPIRVLSPIRYGRRSQSRSRTYTMVFANELVPAGLGSAVVLPCRATVSAPSDLIDEAQQLWAAEQPDASSASLISAAWGAVGVLWNPFRVIPEQLKAGWSDRVEKERDNYRDFRHAANEQAALGPDGLLTIPWPLTLERKEVELDAILATATQPTLLNATYPSVIDISEAWLSAPQHRDYFDNNRRFGITTFQDGEIGARIGQPPGV